MTSKLSAEQLDRALGALWGLAAGEALVTLDADGAWGEGTALSIPILEQVGAGLDLCSAETQGRIVRRWIEWALSTPDAGLGPEGGGGDEAAGAGSASLAFSVLNRLARHDWEEQADDIVAAACVQTARTVAAQRAREISAAGDASPPAPDCGALLRSGVLALAYLHDSPESPALADAARALAALTDPSPETAEACVVWTAMLRSAIMHGAPHIDKGLSFLGPAGAKKWLALIENLPAARATSTTFSTSATSPASATSAISTTATSPPAPAPDDAVPDTNSCASNLLAAYLAFTHEAFNTSFKTTMEKVLDKRGKYYTQPTVALTGALAGAVLGARAVPAEFKRSAHGWPSIVEDALERLVTEAIDGAASGVTTRGASASAHHAAPVPGYADAPGYADEVPGYARPPPPPALDDAPTYFSTTAPPAPGYDAPPPLPPSYDAPPPLYM